MIRKIRFEVYLKDDEKKRPFYSFYVSIDLNKTVEEQADEIVGAALKALYKITDGFSIRVRVKAEGIYEKGDGIYE